MNDLITKLDNVLPSDSVVEDFYAEYNGDDDFNRKLNEVLPEVEMCERQKQNNPWHKFNVLGHILHSVEEMNKLSKGLDVRMRRMLAYVMFFHDIGKPAKHLVRKKDGRRIDSFFNHNIESAKIAREVLPMFKFSNKEVMIMDKLVYKHDIFMFITDIKTENPHHRFLTKELIQKEIDELSSVGDGVELMRYLIMIGRADNLAQNENMTGESLARLDKFDKLLDEIIISEL